MGDTAVTCPHGDRMCPCNDDGAACHYEPLEVAGVVSPADVCTNPACGVCRVNGLTLRLEQRPWTLNSERSNSRGHWNRAALTREWRDAFHLLAIEAGRPHFDAVVVTATPEVRNRSGMPDTGACIGAAKAAIDGIVDAGVLDADGPDIVRRLTFEAPIVTGTDALVLRIDAA